MSPLILAALLAVSPLSAPAQAPTLLGENARVIVGDGTVPDLRAGEWKRRVGSVPVVWRCEPYNALKPR